MLLPSPPEGPTSRAHPRVAVLTLRGSRYGQHLLRTMALTVGRPALVVVSDNPFSRRWRLLRSVAGRIGWLDAVLYAIEETIWTIQPSTIASDAWPGYHAFAEVVAHVPSVSSPVVIEHLKRYGIDLLLLGQSGIVPEPVFAAPRMGTINAHPGWLPDDKGIDCAAWTILEGRFDRVGSSLHRVDRGVDTGPIISRRPYRWRGDETLPTIEARLYDDCVDLLVEAVAASRRGPLPVEANAGGSLRRKMPRADRSRARTQLNQYLATLRIETDGSRESQTSATGTEHSPLSATRVENSPPGSMR